MGKLTDILKPKSDEEIEDIKKSLTKYRIKKFRERFTLQWYDKDAFIFRWKVAKVYTMAGSQKITGDYGAYDARKFIRQTPNIKNYYAGWHTRLRADKKRQKERRIKAIKLKLNLLYSKLKERFNFMPTYEYYNYDD